MLIVSGLKLLAVMSRLRIACGVNSRKSILLTYSMERSPSWEANWFSASQEIPRISRNPNVHYRIHECPPPVTILRQLNPVHNPTSHFLKIHLNIILSSTPASPKRSLNLRFPHQNNVYASPVSHTRYMPCPSHSSRFCLPNSFGWGVRKSNHTRNISLASFSHWGLLTP